jgi:hypothetical protein
LFILRAAAMRGHRGKCSVTFKFGREVARAGPGDFNFQVKSGVTAATALPERNRLFLSELANLFVVTARGPKLETNELCSF